MATPDIKGTGADPTHHVVLFDGETELGFVVTDQGGDLDERTFRRFPFATPTDPYVTEKQPSFGGGFGQHKFEDDRSKYWKSEGVDTTKDKLVLGPQFHYAEGAYMEHVTFVEHSDKKFSWTKVTDSQVWLSQKFTTPASFGTSSYIKFWLKQYGTATGDLLLRVFTDSGGDPGGQVGSTFTINPTHYDNIGQWVRAFKQINLAAATVYHFVWEAPGATDEDNCWAIGGNGTQSGGNKSADGSSWAAADNDFWYRIEAATISTGDPNASNATHLFYEYKGAMYFVQHFDLNTSDKLWMNGWRGAADVNGSGRDNLDDSTNTDWAARITGEEVVEIVAGPTSGEQEDWRYVNGDDLGELANGVLPVTPNWRRNNRITDDYIVKNTNWFYEIAPAAVSLKKVSDIATANGMVFFCRTNQRQVVAHREWNNQGTWQSETVDEWKSVDQNADFAEVVRDPRLGNFIWFGQNASESNDLRPDVCRSQVTAWNDWTMNYKSLCKIRASEWVSAHADVGVLADGGENTLLIGAIINKVDTVSISTPGATYTNGQHTATLVDPGSSGTAQVVVTVTAGALASIDSYGNRGYDYTTGAKTITGVPGGDGNARITITGLDGFNGTGMLAYYDFKDLDEAAYTIDVRYMDEFGVDVMYNMYQEGGEQQHLDAGDLTFRLDDTPGSQSVLSTMGFPLLRSGEAFGGPGSRLPAESTLAATDGAEAITSVSFALAAPQTKTFHLRVYFHIRGFNDADVVTVGHRDGDDITGLNSYGDPEALWVFTESGMGEVSNNRYKPVPLRELAVAHHPNNGQANEVHDVYLMFSWRGRLQRYFRQNLEDLGPDFPSGLNDIAGNVVDVVTYPNRMYAAVDGGESGRSMVLCFKGGAWHEVHTGFVGERIRKLFIQAIPGKSDRLWASVGPSVMWFPITLDSAELSANSDYTYNPNGFLDTSWIYTENMELNKLWRSVIMVRNRAGDTDLTTNVYYQIDDEDAAWTQLDTVTDLSASAKEYDFSDGTAGAQIQGNRVRFRIELNTADLTKAPVVRSLQTRTYRLPEVRFAWTWIAKASSISINLRGDEERTLGTQVTITAALAKMDEWGANMTQLKVDTNIKAFDDRTVLMEPLPYQLLTIVSDENIEEDVIQVSVNDI